MKRVRTTIELAAAGDREDIYAIRHEVFARELKQHPENSAATLMDRLDGHNEYLVAKEDDRVVGFVAITPPATCGYSIDKYFARAVVPLAYDDGLYEVRLLTVLEHRRRRQLAPLLMYGALRYVESKGARTIVALGRRELLEMYEHAGLKRRGLQTVAGAVTYELMTASVTELQDRMKQFESLIRRMARAIDWRVPGVPYRETRRLANESRIS